METINYVQPIEIVKDNVKLAVEFNGDVAILGFYYKDKLVDSITLPRTNATVRFISDESGYKENTINHYIYRAKHDELIENGVITYIDNTMQVRNIEQMIDFLINREEKTRKNRKQRG
jgi:hypothetical protein